MFFAVGGTALLACISYFMAAGKPWLAILFALISFFFIGAGFIAKAKLRKGKSSRRLRASFGTIDFLTKTYNDDFHRYLVHPGQLCDNRYAFLALLVCKTNAPSKMDGKPLPANMFHAKRMPPFRCGQAPLP